VSGQAGRRGVSRSTSGSSDRESGVSAVRPFRPPVRREGPATAPPSVPVQRTPAMTILQREEVVEDDEIQMKPMPQREAPVRSIWQGPVTPIQRDAVHKDGANRYETRSFDYLGDGRERPFKASFYPRFQIGRGAAPDPLGFIASDDSRDPEVRAGWHRGHVAAFSQGGVDESYNIVPMKPGFNRGGTWRGVEENLSQYQGDDRYRVEISPLYVGPDPRIPSSMKVQIIKDKKKKPPSYYAHQGETTAVPLDPLLTLLRDDPTAQDLKKAKAYLIAGHLPPSDKSDWPDQPADRPYERLDIKKLSGRLVDGTGTGAYRDFSNEQRRLIIEANLAKNGGQLRSDDPADPHQILNEDGTADFPEVDHIIPKSSGGSNAYSNARVVSWDLNNRVARVKGISHLVDVTRLAYGAAPNLGDAVQQILIRAPGGGVTRETISGLLSQHYNVEDKTSNRKKIKAILDELVLTGEVVLTVDTYKPAL
jgi:hypothetical protein